MGKAAGSMKIIFGAIFPILAILFAVVYIIIRTLIILVSDYAWYEITLAWVLLGAECFILMHGVGYFLEIYHVVRRRGSLKPVARPIPRLKTGPPVAIIVSSFKEPLDVVENTLISFYNLTYPNKRIYFLDDTRYDLPGGDPAAMAEYRRSIDDLCRRIGVDLFRRRWRGAKAGMINDFLAFIEGEPREGFEFQNLSGRPRGEREKYIIVFDADQNPFPHFVGQLVARMEENPRLAFIQTPQYYTNFETNRIARAAGLQQAVFYEYICEGKSIEDAMFCCGTNVIFRREALMDVGGFEERSVTEDFATSLKFHLRGWGSAYVGDVLAFGMGPEDLGGFFKQQFRWALGTVGLLRQVLAYFMRHPGKLPAVKWWEYLLSCTHYLIGFVFFILAMCPILYLWFGIPTYLARPEIYLIFFLPYLVITVATFFWTLRQRSYRIGDLLSGQLLMAITFPVYIKASLQALLGIRGTFVVTPKGKSASLPLADLWPQLTLAAMSFSAIVWGANRLVYERDPLGGIVINMLWCLYHLGILSSVFYFNEPTEGGT
ncbi:MAG: glycosyltransferase [Deltaproteobacteria bacterium]|nr:glycosyltransferase [Deltaproteobacteria bacterium]